jgi:hypothetical protein
MKCRDQHERTGTPILSRRRRLKVFSLSCMAGLLTLALGVPSLPAAVGAKPPPPSTVANVQTSTDAGLQKIVSPILREKAMSGGEEQNVVIVFMTEDSDLGGLVQNIMTRRPMQGITYATGRMRSGNLAKLAGSRSASQRPLR